MYFSVIVPVYGVEPYLRECVESILSQTFRDFELILVDDGSPDGCGAICDGYAARDGRVRVIHKENGGLVSARQAGIELASGEYVVNVDGDDWVAADFLARAHALTADSGADMACFAASRVTEGKAEMFCEPVAEGLYEGERLRKEILSRQLMGPDMGHMLYYLWGKAIRRTLLYRRQMAVDRRISLGEDVTCLTPLYRDVRRVYICHAPVYFYRQRGDSDSRRFRTEQCEQARLGILALERLEGEPGLAAQLDRYASFMCFLMLWNLIWCRAWQDYGEVKRFIRLPELRRHLKAARFQGVTPKMRVTYFLFRHDRIDACFWFLRLCKRLKGSKSTR